MNIKNKKLLTGLVGLSLLVSPSCAHNDEMSREDVKRLVERINEEKVASEQSRVIDSVCRNVVWDVTDYNSSDFMSSHDHDLLKNCVEEGYVGYSSELAYGCIDNLRKSGVFAYELGDRVFDCMTNKPEGFYSIDSKDVIEN